MQKYFRQDSANFYKNIFKSSWPYAGPLSELPFLFMSRPFLFMIRTFIVLRRPFFVTTVEKCPGSTSTVLS
jgi:hypothetical protein